MEMCASMCSEMEGERCDAVSRAFQCVVSCMWMWLRGRMTVARNGADGPRGLGAQPRSVLRHRGARVVSPERG